MKRNLNINSKINEWTIISNPFYLEDKEHYKIKCKCGKEEIRSRRSLERPNFSISCRKCSQLRRRKQDRKYKIGMKIQNLIILDIISATKNTGTLYKVQCNCGHIYYTGHSKISTKYNNKKGVLPYCNNCFTYDKKSPKKSTMLTQDISLTIYKRLIREADRKGIKFDLTVEYLQDLFEKQNKECIYTGIKLNIEPSISKKESRILNTASLDRIDSKKGYIKNNVQWIHKDINYMKFNFSNKKFIDLCTLIANKHANIEPSLTSTCEEGAETTGTDTNLSDNTSKSVRHPGLNKEPFVLHFKNSWSSDNTILQDEDIVRS